MRSYNLLVDTNIYGIIVADPDLDSIRKGIQGQSSLVIFGLSLIRKELRATPKKLRIDIGNLRTRLLGLYDELTRDRMLSYGKEVEILAKAYDMAYKEFGGALGREAMHNDFLIVASASLHSMDIVVSEDDTSMKSTAALRAYSLVNSLKKAHIPSFLGYDEFKKLLR